MPATDDPIEQLARAIDQADAIISRIRPDQAALPTPCDAWDVEALARHVVQDVRQFTARASGSEEKDADTTASGDDWLQAYRGAARRLIQAWRRDGALEGTVKLPFGEFPPTWFVGQQIADLVVHGWDLAKATGQPTDLDADLAEASLAWGKENLRPQFRGDEGSGQQFGAEVSVPEDAPVSDRLVAWFGRDPDWSPTRSS